MWGRDMYMYSILCIWDVYMHVWGMYVCRVSEEMIWAGCRWAIWAIGGLNKMGNFTVYVLETSVLYLINYI